jgi:Lipocalin-like domain
MKNVILLLLILGIFSCKSNEFSEPAANEFVGTWKLVSYCQPATSACKPIIVPVEKGVFISFTNDLKFNEFYTNMKPIEYAFMGCGGGGYKIEGNDLRIYASCMSSLAGRLFPVASVDSKRLVLYYTTPKEEYVFEKQ